ncbi:hypothetical protein NC652_014602 [Populus alba x Populus x berolinensis]|uniref:Uncharacterized protein n=1 Tax=Populus alba x Populus x berolinensis TaxID=444605 RepID=A0AAD6QXL3_9ROSI|nr:hypothetical protein NC652_014602 [Populus alba x Populus x berolinensis]KAJ6998426.1 hypothetical protein NC653_014570 [Populus alba x Populus x berolinensis]
MAGCETCVPEILMALAWYYYKPKNWCLILINKNAIGVKGRKGTRNILKCLYSGLGFGGLSGRKSNATLDFSMCVCTNRSDGAPNLIGFQVKEAIGEIASALVLVLNVLKCVRYN